MPNSNAMFFLAFFCCTFKTNSYFFLSVSVLCVRFLENMIRLKKRQSIIPKKFDINYVACCRNNNE